MSALALCACWRLYNPILIERVAETVTREAHWYNYIVDRMGVAGLREADPDLEIATTTPSSTSLALQGDNPWGRESNQKLSAAVRSKGEVVKITERLDPTTGTRNGFWLELKKKKSEGDSICILSKELPYERHEWDLIIAISVLAGVLGGSLLHLRRQLIEPLRKLLQQLPITSTRQMTLMDESGGPVAREIAGQINRFLACLNSSHEAQRLLLRGLTHDIRGPLGRLKLRCEQISEGIVTLSELKEEIDEMNHDLDQLCELSARVYAYADSLADDQKSAEIQLTDLLAQVVASYNNSSIQMDCGRFVVKLPAIALKRCLNNLIDNALEYGRPPVLVNARMSNNLLVISVEDHGDGLRSSNQLLLPRMPAANDREESSHRGLGLGIVEQFCKNQGGSIKLTRSPSCGGLRVQLMLPQEGR